MNPQGQDIQSEPACPSRLEKISTSHSVAVINLGCARNTVDSQIILGGLRQKGFMIGDPNGAHTVIVNTCAFIDEAKKESIDTILDLIELKKKGTIKKIIIAGCMGERYGAALTKELKEIDAVCGVLSLEKEKNLTQVALTPLHYAYVKICESCFHRCSFCIIPKIKGPFASRTMPSVLQEIQVLDQKGIQEINMIGQDITSYGLDLYGKKCLDELLKKICSVTQHIRWIRLLYLHPLHITDELIRLIACEAKICSYVDIPLQHINDRILKRMNRGFAKRQTLALIKKIRDRIPGVTLRTTLIVGFPGETQDEFKELVEFVEQTQFDRLGVFMYSREEGTLAYDFPDQIPDRIKEERFNILMSKQRKISEGIQKKYGGKMIDVLIDDRDKESNNTYLGRSAHDAPDVDGCVYVRSSRELHPGDLLRVQINDTLEYDLVGEAR
ncbi:MAG: 30S ribosomal protein S12 methylthiotransferase RimO [Candidatus Omnitrophota bacterium]